MAAVTLAYPVNAELDMIEQVTLPQLLAEANNPFLDNFPEEPHESDTIMWEQLDNFTGLMGFRGYGNKPNLVGRVGAQRFITRPGVFGDFIPLYEEELTRRRALGRFSGKMRVDDLIAQAQQQLLIRRLQLKAKIVADFVTTGAYSVPDQTGVVYSGDTWTPATSASTTAWSDPLNSTPLKDIQTAVQVAFGQSVDFGPSAELVLNTLKINQLLLNRNAADFWGYRQMGGATVGGSLNEINVVLNSQGLPKIRAFDGYYLADNGTRRGLATRYTPTGTGVLFGRRTNGAKAGAFAMTWNLNAGGKPEAYNKVFYRGQIEVPESIEVHHGFNGGPLLRYPGTIVLLTGI